MLMTTTLRSRCFMLCDNWKKYIVNLSILLSSRLGWFVWSTHPLACVGMGVETETSLWQLQQCRFALYSKRLFVDPKYKFVKLPFNELIENFPCHSQRNFTFFFWKKAKDFCARDERFNITKIFRRWETISQDRCIHFQSYKHNISLKIMTYSNGFRFVTLKLKGLFN